MGEERELKLALETREDYETTCRVLPGFVREIVQENSYWDFPARGLTAAGVMVRLRLEGERARITVKRAAHTRDDGLFVAPEDEQSVDGVAARDVLAGTRSLVSLGGDVLDRLAAEFGPLDALERWGDMVNRRRVYRLAEDIEAEVDSTRFPGDVMDYEVELETEHIERARRLLLEHLEPAGVRWRPQTLTKSERLQEHQ